VSDAADQPACPGANRLGADNVIVAPVKGDLVRWCAGWFINGIATFDQRPPQAASG